VVCAENPPPSRQLRRMSAGQQIFDAGIAVVLLLCRKNAKAIVEAGFYRIHTRIGGSEKTANSGF
jgi:hypothetical protein